MSQKTYREAELVWAKMRGHPHWPAKVVRAPKGQPRPQGKLWIFFYGTHEHAWMMPADLCHYEENKEKFSLPKKIKGFAEAIWEIEEDPDLVITLGKPPRKKSRQSAQLKGGSESAKENTGEQKAVLQAPPPHSSSSTNTITPSPAHTVTSPLHHAPPSSKSSSAGQPSEPRYITRRQKRSSEGIVAQITQNFAVRMELKSPQIKEADRQTAMATELVTGASSCEEVEGEAASVKTEDEEDGVSGKDGECQSPERNSETVEGGHESSNEVGERGPDDEPTAESTLGGGLGSVEGVLDGEVDGGQGSQGNEQPTEPEGDQGTQQETPSEGTGKKEEIEPSTTTDERVTKEAESEVGVGEEASVDKLAEDEPTRPSTDPPLPRLSIQEDMTTAEVLMLLNYKLKASLSVQAPDVAEARDVLQQLLSQQITHDDLNQVPGLVATVRKVRRFYGSEAVCSLADKLYLAMKSSFARDDPPSVVGRGGKRGRRLMMTSLTGGHAPSIKKMRVVANGNSTEVRGGLSETVVEDSRDQTVPSLPE